MGVTSEREAMRPEGWEAGGALGGQLREFMAQALVTLVRALRALRALYERLPKKFSNCAYQFEDG